VLNAFAWPDLTAIKYYKNTFSTLANRVNTINGRAVQVETGSARVKILYTVPGLSSSTVNTRRLPASVAYYSTFDLHRPAPQRQGPAVMNWDVCINPTCLICSQILDEYTGPYSAASSTRTTPPSWRGTWPTRRGASGATRA
jgi:hypothetical protein